MLAFGTTRSRTASLPEPKVEPLALAAARPSLLYLTFSPSMFSQALECIHSLGTDLRG